MAPEPETTLEIVCSPHPDIHIRNVNFEDSAMTIVLEGQIRYQSVASLQEFLFEQFCSHMPQSLTLDFKRVHFLDSQGLAFLIALYKFCYPQGCSLTIGNASSHVKSLIELTRLNAFIKLT